MLGVTLRCHLFCLKSFKTAPQTLFEEQHHPFFILLLILVTGRGRQRETERHRLVVPLIYAWLILFCALTGNQTHNHGKLDQHSNPLRYLDRAASSSFLSVVSLWAQGFNNASPES